MTDTAAAGYDQWCTETLGADFGKYTQDYNQGYRDGLSGDDAHPGPRDGDAMAEYQEGYDKGHYEFAKKQPGARVPSANGTQAAPAAPPAGNDPAARLDEQYRGWLAERNWEQAAELLNGFNRNDITKRLAELQPDQVASIHQGALDNPRVGPQSQLALMTGAQGGGSSNDRFAQAIKLAAGKVGGAAGAKLLELASPASIAMMTAFVGLYVAAQWTPAGWAADGILVVTLVASAALMGKELSSIIDDIKAFVSITSNPNADLDTAADHLAKAVAAIGVDTLMLILMHKAGAAAKPYIKPPTGFVDMVASDGSIVRVPADSAPPNASQSTGSGEPGNTTKPGAGGEPGKGTKAGADPGAGGPGKLLGNTSVLKPAELAVAQEFAAAGHTVEIVETGPGRTPDFKIDGVQTELKTVSGVADVSDNGLSKAMASRIMDGRGQASSVLVDARTQPGMTKAIAERGMRRAFGADNATAAKAGIQPKLQKLTILTPEGPVTAERQ